MDKSEATETLEKIKEGDETFLKALYNKNRPAFIGWLLRHYGCTEEDAQEAYQRSFSVLYFNVKDGKVTELTSSVETYLYGIGKNVIKRIFSSNNKEHVSLDQIAEHQTDELNYYDKADQTHQKEMVKMMLNKIGDPCKSVLLMHYFKKYSMESIAQHMGYKTESVAKKKKFLCLQKLKEMVKQKSS